MRTKTILSMLILTVVAITFGLTEAKAGFPAPPGLPGLPAPNVNVRIEGYLPAPPGVNIQIDAGRPYYVERDRRIYIERERPAGHYKKKKKHHKDNGRKNGHYKHKQNRHDH
ncbi:MAG: hypothetical protein WA140_01030 [Geobacteraceae bacterium]